MPNPMDFARMMIQNNPRIAGNPNAQEMVNVIMSGDQAKGEQIARNLCNSMGTTPEEALRQASGFFRI